MEVTFSADGVWKLEFELLVYFVSHFDQCVSCPSHASRPGEQGGPQPDWDEAPNHQPQAQRLHQTGQDVAEEASQGSAAENHTRDQIRWDYSITALIFICNNNEFNEHHVDLGGKRHSHFLTLCLVAWQTEEPIKDDLQEAGRRHSEPVTGRGGQQGPVAGLSGQLGQEDTIYRQRERLLQHGRQ